MSELDMMIDCYEKACDGLEKQNKTLRDERDRLALHLDAALDHAQQYSEGCLYCGEGEIIDGETTPEHQAECWWYRAKAAVTPAGQRWTRRKEA